MAYATRANIESEFKNVVFSATTLVTITEVDEAIAETDLVIDSFLSRRYVVPVTGINTLILVRGYSKQIVAARIGPTLGIKSNSQKTDNPKNETPAGHIMKMLKLISEGKADLPADATFKTQSTTAKFHTEKRDERIFDVQKQQW